jgi:hypothetical protein
MYQMVINIPNVCKIFQTVIKYINNFRSKALQNFPKLGFLVWKQTIWQPCARREKWVGGRERGRASVGVSSVPRWAWMGVLAKKCPHFFLRPWRQTCASWRHSEICEKIVQTLENGKLIALELRSLSNVPQRRFQNGGVLIVISADGGRGRFNFESRHLIFLPCDRWGESALKQKWRRI